MKKKEFESAVCKALDGQGYRKPEVEASFDSDGTLKIEISRMYEYVDLTFEHLEAITKLCGSKQLNIGEKNHADGCDTCDYGSRYTVSLFVKNAKPFD